MPGDLLSVWRVNVGEVGTRNRGVPEHVGRQRPFPALDHNLVLVRLEANRINRGCSPWPDNSAERNYESDGASERRGWREGCAHATRSPFAGVALFYCAPNMPGCPRVETRSARAAAFRSADAGDENRHVRCSHLEVTALPEVICCDDPASPSIRST